MNWNKLKQQMESFLSPKLVGRIEYKSSGYRFSPDKPNQCYMVLDKKEIFNMKDTSTDILWYKTEQEIKNDVNLRLVVTEEDIQRVRASSGGKIPEERLSDIAKKHKMTQCSKDIFKAQLQMNKSDFKQVASTFLSESIETSLESDDILMNIFALVDRRVGKKRLVALEREMQMKHPIVRHFYNLRRNM